MVKKKIASTNGLSQPATHDTLPTSRVVPGDGLETMATWPEDSIDLIFADPPYNIGYAYDKYDDTRSDDEYIDWTCQWLDACSRLLAPTGSMYILIGDEYAAETRMHLKTLEADGQLCFRNWIVWHYTFGQNCKAKFNRSHAHLFYAVGSAGLNKWKVSDPPFVFNRQAIAVPSARQTTYKDPRANPVGKLPDDTWYLRPQQPEIEGDARYFRPDEDTWYISRLAGTFGERLAWHPCQLPEAMLERIIKLSSNESQIVFDPFVGSGTTLAVAARLKRRWLGCELSEEYARLAQERIEICEKTGKPVKTTKKQKGIEPGKQKKRPEPHRSPKKKDAKPGGGAIKLFGED